MSKLQTIIGSTRPGRAADHVAALVIEKPRVHGGFDGSQLPPAVFRISASPAALDEAV